MNPHRDKVVSEIAKLAEKFALKMEVFDSVYGNYRDVLIDSSKIVINIGNIGYPEDTGQFLRTMPNLHRIRYLLGRGKVVISEKSGLFEEEAAYSGVVIFADTASLFKAAYALILAPELRRELELRALKFAEAEQVSRPLVLS